MIFNLMLQMNIPKKLQNAIIDSYRKFLLYDAKMALPNEKYLTLFTMIFL